MEAAKRIELDWFYVKLHPTLPWPKVEDSVHVYGRHLYCFYGRTEANNPSTDRSSCGDLGIGPDNGSQGGSLFSM